MFVVLGCCPVYYPWLLLPLPTRCQWHPPPQLGQPGCLQALPNVPRKTKCPHPLTESHCMQAATLEVNFQVLESKVQALFSLLDCANRRLLQTLLKLHFCFFPPFTPPFFPFAFAFFFLIKHIVFWRTYKKNLLFLGLLHFTKPRNKLSL